jgi:hypothetical protein
MSNNEGPFFNAQFKLDPLPPNEGGLADEHCKAKLTQIQDIGRHRHEQVRIEFQTASGLISAIYTVSTFHKDAELVSLGDKIKTQVDNCQLSPDHKCNGVVKDQIMIKGLSEGDAKDKDELIELLKVGQNRKLVVIASHGGDIEPWTDIQAEHVRSHLPDEPDDRVTLWMCKGFVTPGNDDDKDAYKRWHITATEIS